MYHDSHSNLIIFYFRLLKSCPRRDSATGPRFQTVLHTSHTFSISIQCYICSHSIGNHLQLFTVQGLVVPILVVPNAHIIFISEQLACSIFARAKIKVRYSGSGGGAVQNYRTCMRGGGSRRDPKHKSTMCNFVHQGVGCPAGTWYFCTPK